MCNDDYRPNDILWRQPDEANVAYLDFSGALAAARRLIAAEISKSPGNGRVATGAEERAKLAEATEFEDNTTSDAIPVSSPKLCNTEMSKFAHFTTVYQYVPVALEYQFTCF